MKEIHFQEKIHQFFDINSKKRYKMALTPPKKIKYDEKDIQVPIFKDDRKLKDYQAI
jgi:hypothetical protein